MDVHTIDRLRSEYEGTLPQFSYVGAYTLIYLTENGDTLCASCATDEMALWDNGHSDDPPASYGTYDEGPAIQCDGCNKAIASSYGDPGEV